MPDEINANKFDFGALSKPADTLIKKVSKAVGGIFEPWQITRVAKAEAEAALIKANSEIQVTDLHRRAVHRFIEEEARHQANIESIMGQAIPRLQDAADAAKVDDDWMTNFFGKCRNISNEQMQGLWAKVLAGEVNIQGAFSRNTVNLLASWGQKEAELFNKLCSFTFGPQRLLLMFNTVLDVTNQIYSSNGITFASLLHLEALGVVQLNDISDFKIEYERREVTMEYFGQKLFLYLSDRKLITGRARLTEAGRELAEICKPKKVDGFFDFVRNQWHYSVDHGKTDVSNVPN